MSAAESREPVFVVRPGRASDHAFVFSGWLGGDRFSPAGQSCARVYQVEQERLVGEILARPGAELRVACAPDDDDALFGWAVLAPSGELPCIHYVYVKKGLRRMGIASALVGELLMKRCEYSHQPVVAPTVIREGGKAKSVTPFYPPRNWTYNPYRKFR